MQEVINDKYLERELTVNNLIKKCEALEKTISEVLNGNGNEFGRYTSYRLFAQMYNDIAKEAADKHLFIGRYNTFNLEQIPSECNTTWLMQKIIMENVLVNTRMLITLLSTDNHFKRYELYNIENFIKSNLRSCFDEMPKNEKEIQKAIENLFIGKGMSKGIDFDRETGKVKYSSKEYTPDFILLKMNMCIEVKYIKENTKNNRIIDQINADIPAYSKKYQNILFVIYDVGTIKNEIEFKRDIESNKNSDIKVIIIKH